jgi:pyrroloquinoline quinone (PQQ) biosynthesis protein C
VSGLATAESERLRRKIELVLPVLLGAGKRLVEHSHARELYRAYLVASHGVIRASVPLMESALARSRALAAADPVAAGLADYLERHADEELGHDDWLLEDLEAVGGDREEALAEPPSAAVATLVGAPYYWILHYHPVAVLGYIALLEGYPPTMAEVDRWMTATGYPREAFRTLIRHAELDPLHRDEMDEALDALPLTREHSAVIGLTALHSVHAFAGLLEELLEHS